jgi:hypothetical protein
LAGVLGDIGSYFLPVLTTRTPLLRVAIPTVADAIKSHDIHHRQLALTVRLLWLLQEVRLNWRYEIFL